MSSKNVFMGFLAGAATGALIGVLYAPDKGEKTRKKIKKNSTRYAEDMKEGVNDFMEEIKERFDGLKADVNETAKETKEKVEELKKKASTSVN